jgi:predicted RNA-binding protein with TRAM domain
MAFAEPTGKPAGTDPLPVSAAPARAPRAPRAFAPGPGDSAAHVVPGAVIAATITEPSEKNPASEGVTRVNGLVVFVRGATTVGQAVNVRITERRERIAVGEVTTDAPTALPAPAAPAVAPVAAPVAEPVAVPEAPAAEPVAPAAEPAAAPAL